MDSLILITLLSILCTVPVTNTPRADDPAPAASRIELRQSPLVDLYYWLRHLADPRSDARSDDRVADSVAAVGKIDRELGNPLVWGLLEADLADPACLDAGALERAYLSLPETFRLLDGKKVPLRALARRLARALRAAEPSFRKAIWPEDLEAIEAARTGQLPRLIEHQAECLHDIIGKLGMEDPGVTIPVYLVAHSPCPGGFTHRRRGGGGVCFIGLDAFEGQSLLWEGILHEATHALDVATARQETVLTTLRSRLGQAGIKGPLERSIVHTVMFAQAASTVVRLLDPEHRPYGVVSGYYRKVGAAGRLVPPAWSEYVAGRLSREALLDRLVEESRKVRKAAGNKELATPSPDDSSSDGPR